MVSACRAEAARTGRPLSEVTDAWVRRTVAEGGRVMGFGHRVYKVRDPRADVLAAAVERLFPMPGANPLYDDARAVEAVVLEVLTELKPGRRLQTNVEFYTALLLHGLGLPSAAFTPTFAVARVGGWTAHVLEQVAADRLIRPLVAYVGARERRWGDDAAHAGEARPAP
jgi:citrate synthase